MSNALKRPWACLVALVVAGCAQAPATPEQTACLTRLQAHVDRMRPAFEAAGLRQNIYVRLDERLEDGRGFRKSESIYADATASGVIRLRPSRVCDDPVVAQAVLAHEMAHVALEHIGTPGPGLVLSWERPPKQEAEADTLALRVLKATGANPRASLFLRCRLGQCAGFAGSPGKATAE